MNDKSALGWFASGKSKHQVWKESFKWETSTWEDDCMYYLCNKWREALNV